MELEHHMCRENVNFNKNRRFQVPSVSTWEVVCMGAQFPGEISIKDTTRELQLRGHGRGC